MNYLLAHDVGTSGDKAALITPDGRVVATAFEPYPTHYPRRLWAEQNPEDWWRAVGHTTQRVLEQGGVGPGEVLGLAFSTQMINLIPLDAMAMPLRPCISWLDGRAGAEAKMVMRRLGGRKAFALIVGATLTGKDLLPKYLWLKRSEPDVYSQAATFVDASGYLLYQATGRLAYEWSTASVTGLFSLKSKTWSDFLIRFFGLDRAKFPELVQSTEKVGSLRPAAASHLGLLAGTPVFGGAGDAMSAAVGSGAVGEREGHLSLGTSGFVGIVTSKRLIGRRGIATIQSADPTKLLLIGETETAAACLRWAAKELYGAESEAGIYKRMDDDVAGTEPGAGGLIFTPWLYGERCPVADERLRAGFLNLGANHSRAQMTRAIYEGVAYNLRWIIESIADLYKFRPDPLRVVGGGALGLPWLQIVADVTGCTLESVPHPQEAGAVGAAMLAAVGLGLYPSVEAIKTTLSPSSVIVPDPAPRPFYDESYAAFRAAYRSLRRFYKDVNRKES